MMPMGDFFAPDINFVPSRNIYPTSPGGTLTGAGAAMSPATSTVVPDSVTGEPGPTTVSSVAPVSFSGRSVLWWLGFLALLVAMVWVSRKVGGPDEFRNIRPTAYNFLTITLTAIVGIVGLKVIAARWRIPGASDIIMAV